MIITTFYCIEDTKTGMLVDLKLLKEGYDLSNPGCEETFSYAFENLLRSYFDTKSSIVSKLAKTYNEIDKSYGRYIMKMVDINVKEI